MARSEIKTWLPLDEFAQIIGINPMNFNQLSSATFNQNNVCGETFFQFDWQHSDRIGRDTIAMAIQQAEMEMSREAGFNLMPEWTIEERLEYPRPSQPSVYNLYGVNVNWMGKSVEAERGHILYGGVKATTLLERSAPIVRTDADGDGYAETCTITSPTTVTDINEIHICYSGKDINDGWDIRPIKVSLSAGNAIITFKAWQVVDRDKQEIFGADVLDADDATNYETTADVYRVYNDPATQAQFIWENDPSCCGTCTACQLGTQAGCFHLRDPRLGIVVPSPASWDVATSAFVTQNYSYCREPDQIRLWYRSGWVDNTVKRPYAELSNYWKYAVAYFAASKFERSVCGCSNVNQFIEKWRRDAAFVSQEEGGITLTAELQSNRLGTSMGAIYAYRKIHQNGVRVNK